MVSLVVNSANTDLSSRAGSNELAKRLYIATMYRKVSNIRRTKSQNLNDSRLVLQLSLPNPLKPCVKLRMKM